MFEHAGRYKIISKLGEGAMAEVFRAHDPEMGRSLAVKILNERFSADNNFRTRFLRESRAAGVLSHPNIVTMYDVGEVQGRPFIAMELLEGASLDQRMRAGKKFSMRETVALGVQLAEALDYAHARGIVHRDIKPSNLILLSDDATLKIADFGIARIDAPDVTSHTQTADVLGTPQYMSPEQVLGKKIDGRSDLFSVGIVLYQLLSGEKPFVAETLGTLLFRIATEPPRPLREVKADLPREIYAIVDRLLSKEPQQRYESGAALAKALRPLLKDGATSGATTWRDDVVMWGVAALVFVLVGGASLWYWSAGTSGDAVTAAPPQQVATPESTATPARVESGPAPRAVEPTASNTIRVDPTPVPARTTAENAAVVTKTPSAPVVARPSALPSASPKRATERATESQPAVTPVSTPGTPQPPSVRASEAPTKSAPDVELVKSTAAPAPVAKPIVAAPAPPSSPPDPAATMSITQAKQKYRDGSMSKDQYRDLVDKIKQRYREDITRLKDQLRSGAIDKRTYKEKAQALERDYQ